MGYGGAGATRGAGPLRWIQLRVMPALAIFSSLPTLACSPPAERRRTFGRDAAQADCAGAEAPSRGGGGAATYADVQPIFESRCADCHSGAAGGPWPLDTYERIADAKYGSKSRTKMPPSTGPVRITKSERTLVLDWLRCGLPR